MLNSKPLTMSNTVCGTCPRVIVFYVFKKYVIANKKGRKRPFISSIKTRTHHPFLYKYRTGLIVRLFFDTSKCTCGPVERPVEPISAMA